MHQPIEHIIPLLFLVLCVLAPRPVAAQPDPLDAAVQRATPAWTRYVETAVALGCSAVEWGSSEDDATREAANTAVLRRFRYTRQSYAADASRFAGDHVAEEVIRQRVEQCRAEATRGVGTQHFKGKVKDGQSIGTVSVSLTGRDATGLVQITFDGQNLSFSTGRQVVKGALVRLVGRFSRGGMAGTYVILARRKGGKLVGRLRLGVDQGRRVELPFELGVE